MTRRDLCVVRAEAGNAENFGQCGDDGPTCIGCGAALCSSCISPREAARLDYYIELGFDLCVEAEDIGALCRACANSRKLARRIARLTAGPGSAPDHLANCADLRGMPEARHIEGVGSYRIPGRGAGCAPQLCPLP